MPSELVNGYVDNAPVYPGVLYGLRVWKKSEPLMYPEDDGPVLRSIFRNCVWKPGIMQAECLKYSGYSYLTGKDEPKPGHEGRVAGIRCECGFFACWDEVDIPVSYVDRASLVFGVVKAYGTVTWGTRGFKASKCEVAALVRIVDDAEFRGRYVNPAGYYGPKKWADGAELTEIAAAYGRVPVVGGFEAAKELFGIEGKPGRR